jgi:hypothetical protein
VADGPEGAGAFLREGYSEGGDQPSLEAVYASVLFSAAMKFPNWIQKNQTKKIECVRNYLQTQPKLL